MEKLLSCSLASWALNEARGGLAEGCVAWLYCLQGAVGVRALRRVGGGGPAALAQRHGSARPEDQRLSEQVTWLPQDQLHREVRRRAGNDASLGANFPGALACTKA